MEDEFTCIVCDMLDLYSHRLSASRSSAPHLGDSGCVEGGRIRIYREHDLSLAELLLLSLQDYHMRIQQRILST